MKVLKFLITLLCFIQLASIKAQDDIKEEDNIEYKSDIKRKSTETAVQFARRCVPSKSAFKHNVLELSFRNAKVGKDIFVCYADTTLVDDMPTIFIQLLSPWIFNKKLVYETVFVAALENGVEGTAKVESVFLANADKDITKELFVITSSNIRIFDDTNNSSYIENRSEVRIFDNIANPCNQNVCLDEMENLEKEFPSSIKPYTAQTIKSKLKTLGL